MSADLQVGLVGAGVMGQVHADAWTRGLPGALVAIYTPDEAARSLARQHGLIACDTLDELYRRVGVVDLCTPTPTHRALTLAAAAAGCHVICEKPAALSAQDALAMARGCERAGVRLFVAQVLRFFPQYEATKAAVDRGEIGEPRVVRLSRVSAPPTAGSWLLDEAQSGGVPLDLMVHDLDYARWLAGEAEQVYAVEARQDGRVTVQATLRHQGGDISLIEAGWAAPAGVFRTSLDVAGTAGSLEWTTDMAPVLRWHGPPAPTSQEGAALPALDGDPYLAELRHAYHALETGQPFRVTPDDAARAVALAGAVQRSITTGRAVSPEVWA